MFSNKYIYIYTTVMVVIVAALLALAATLLQPYQAANKEIEKMQNILQAAGVSSTAEDAQALYVQYIKKEITINQKGDLVAEYKSDGSLLGGKGSRAFDVDMKTALEKGDQAEFPVFLCEKEGGLIYIVPLRGKGLWGPVWGYISFAPDMNTVVGATFDHQGETPGLGAEISTSVFEGPFAGKQIFDPQGQFVSIIVQKGGVKNFKGDPIHAVDAISGGTITSTGVSDMLHDCLQHYVPYFEKIKAIQDSLIAPVVELVVDSLSIVAVQDSLSPAMEAENNQE